VEFLTHANLHVMLRTLPHDARAVVVSAGEIDCREGIAAAVAAGKYYRCGNWEVCVGGGGERGLLRCHL
jgi:hypothetical protein